MVRACLFVLLTACGANQAGLRDAGSDEAAVVDATRPCLPEPADGGWSTEYHFVSDYVADSINLRVNDSTFQWESSGCDFAATDEGRIETASDGGVRFVPLDGGTLQWPGEHAVGQVDRVTLQPLPDGGFVATAGDASTLWQPGTECGCGPPFHACTC